MALLAGTARSADELDPRGPARVVTETYVGGAGTEWLAGAAFLPDNTILLGGVSLDPELVLRGQTATVIGTDAPALPALKAWKRLGSVETGKVAVPVLDQMDKLKDDELELKTEKEIQAEQKKKAAEAKEIAATARSVTWKENEDVETATVYRKLTWADPEATGFLAVMSGDLKQVVTLRRLPRGAGSITGLERAPDGSIYIVGGATERINGISRDVKTLPEIVPVKNRPAHSMPLIYVAKLSPDLSQALWVRTAPSDIYAPRLRLLRNGDVTVASPDLRVFSPAGELKRSHEITRSRNPGTVTVNPVSGRHAKGGDFLTMTGREPYRTPYFFIYNPDGSLELELMRWVGAFAGLDSLRLVADAQVSRMTHDDAGNLIVFSRSHGGNCVQIRYPYDIDRFMPNSLGALPMNSPGCVQKLDLNFNVLGAGVWSDPGFVRVTGHGADGSVAWTGNAREGLTAYVAAPRLDAFRYRQPLTAWGRRLIVASDEEDGAFATGTLDGKPMLLLLSGAVERDETGGRKPPPLQNATQPQFGGGLMDGHAILLDLSPSPFPASVKQVIPTDKKKIVTGEAPLVAADGQPFRLGGEKYFNVQVTLREAVETGLWPRFWQGRADAGGTFTYSTKEATPAAFVLRAEVLQQPDGNQDRRVFGNQIGQTKEKGLTPALWLEVTRMSPWELEEQRHEGEDSIRVTQRAVCKVDGKLHVGERVIAVTGAPSFGGFSVPRGVNPKEAGVRPNQVGLRIEFTVTGKELGFDSDKVVKLRFAATGYSDVKYKSLEPIKVPTVEEMMQDKPKDKLLDELE
jgi:hypothetical protein